MATVRYTTVNGEVLAEKRGGVRRAYVPDPLGSTAALLNTSQAKTDTFSYWPYGEERSVSGSTPTPFRFVGAAGYYRDTSSRSYVRARHYLPGSGRWMTRDFYAFIYKNSNKSPYLYANGNPIYYTDYSGLITNQEIEDWCEGLGYGGGFWGYLGAVLCQAKGLGPAGKVFIWLGIFEGGFGGGLWLGLKMADCFVGTEPGKPFPGQFLPYQYGLWSPFYPFAQPWPDELRSSRDEMEHQRKEKERRRKKYIGPIFRNPPSDYSQKTYFWSRQKQMWVDMKGDPSPIHW